MSNGDQCNLENSLCHAVVAIEEHANDNLLKIDSHDTFLPASAIKKQISAVFPPPITGNPEKNEPLLPGLLRVGKNPKNSFIFFAFDSVENRELALQLLVKSGKMMYRKEPWVEVVVSERDRLVTHKGGNASNSSLKGVIPSDPLSNRSKKREREASGSISVAQWGGIPYFQQIQRKTTHCQYILRKIAVGKVQRQFKSEKSVIDEFSIISSPLIHGYRNHVNFSFGYDRQQRPAIGFFTGSLIDGNGTIEGVTREDKESELIAKTTNYIAILYAKAVMCAYTRVNNVSKGKVVMFDKVTSVAEKVTRVDSKGDAASEELIFFWRRMQVRHSVSGNVMIDIEVDNTDVSEELLSEISNILVEECKKVEEVYEPAKPVSVLLETRPKGTDGVIPSEGIYNDFAVEVDYGELKGRNLEFISSKHVSSVFPNCKLVSLQWHFHSGTRTCPIDIPRSVIYGEVDALTETLCGMKFQLSPRSFFQVNTKATELMLEKLSECAGLSKSTTLLDLCCGTGIIGICLAKHVKLVIGIDMVADAIDDARVNAVNNNVTNTVYYAGKVEDVLNNALNKLSNEDKHDIVAIFDPPRAGMHPSVLKSTRSNQNIRRIIYISCDQNALLRDCPSMMKEPTKAFRGMPFVIEQSFGIDMFPHTPHVEMAVVLNRVSSTSLDTNEVINAVESD
eukprot:Tbor_TRINITY_DN393_c0_g1::TRINITY_DN393_c0_g1_i1::g.15504::m.15504/K15332/TRMT2A; tRNA (uracil-5-)-methyltransferase